MDLETRTRREGGRDLPVLVLGWGAPMRMAATTVLGGGIASRRWVLNAQVHPSYGRRDPEHHLQKLGVSLGLRGRGAGMLTAADVRAARRADDGGVEVLATVGIGSAVLAAAPEAPLRLGLAGTINVVVVVPERLSDGALANAIATVTEAKVQALMDAGISATGTPTDAVCVVCPEVGATHDFCGPRSRWGAPLARAVHAAVLEGARG